jgi:hypothetical protein
MLYMYPIDACGCYSVGKTPVNLTSLKKSCHLSVAIVSRLWRKPLLPFLGPECAVSRACAGV